MDASVCCFLFVIFIFFILIFITTTFSFDKVGAYTVLCVTLFCYTKIKFIIFDNCLVVLSTKSKTAVVMISTNWL